MNMSEPHISDERLSAWLDGELDAAASAEVQAWLARDPEGAQRARQWAVDRDALREHFAPVLQEPVPARLRATVWQHVGWPRWAQAAMAAGLLVGGALAGGGSVWQWQQRQMAQLQVRLAAGTAQGWVQRAALAHSVYVPEPRHAVEVRRRKNTWRAGSHAALKYR